VRSILDDGMEMEKLVVVLGLGKTGRFACGFLEKEGTSFVATDDAIKTAKSVPAHAIHELINQGKVSYIIASPGISLSHPLILEAKKSCIEVFCDIEQAFRLRKEKLIGITGTNGKTTTALLTTHMMNYAKMEAKAVGNIGISILEHMPFCGHLVVEMSSFQLQTIKTQALDVACCLNISANHLDAHASMDEYVQAKCAISSLVHPHGAFFVGKKAYDSYFSKENAAQSVGLDPTCDIFSDGFFLWRHSVLEAEVPPSLYGKRSHDLENFAIAYAICRHLGIAPEVCTSAYDTFCKPPHRIEFVTDRAGVQVYNDSKATNIDAVIRAVETLGDNIVLIAGGVHKGFPYTAWQKAFQGKVKKVFLNGPAAPFIQNDLAGVIESCICGSFEEAVQGAFEYARVGDKVLLSPGCSSYDRFSSYEERGVFFQELALSGFKMIFRKI
jgi:UDP-N-acetylmuramoylalanine--D-glutamate ligase